LQLPETETSREKIMLNREQYEGFFIVFEGLDGSGTSTQVGRLRDRLVGLGLDVEMTEEPSGGPVGALIRQALSGRITLDMYTLALAFAADRLDHLYNDQNGVLKSLREKRIVISDRYVLSSLAYQALEIDDRDWLIEINSHIIKPDLTIFIDTPIEECGRRIAVRSPHYELFHSSEKLNRVRQNYLDAIERFPHYGEVKTFDGRKPINELHEAIFQHVLTVLKEKKYPALNPACRQGKSQP
jgi:dTMP kinase